ncbi:hypothetical protein, partial [Rhodococcus chondri]|uniref:hypothetical protein n=1 Tax=Rhodococcus chondri TaxID=3065941 RepID=UPI0038B4A8C8
MLMHIEPRPSSTIVPLVDDPDGRLGADSHQAVRADLEVAVHAGLGRAEPVADRQLRQVGDQLLAYPLGE